MVGCPEVADILIEAGVDLRTRQEEGGMTALHWVPRSFQPPLFALFVF